MITKCKTKRMIRRMLKPFGVVAGTIGFIVFYLFFVHDAKAAEPQIPAVVILINVGVCDMDTNGRVSKSIEETVYSRKCNIGVSPYAPRMRYISTFNDDGKIESVIEADTVTGMQTIIWHKNQKKI